MEESFPKIRILRVLVTNWCNHRCVFCHNEGQTAQEHQFLDCSAFEQIVSVAKRCGIEQIQFSGGEPLLHPNFISLVETAKYAAPNIGIGMATNGRLVDKKIASRLAPVMNNIRINLPSLYPKNYFLIKRRHDMQQVLDAIDVLIACKAKVGLNTVYVSQTTDEIMELARFVAEREIDLKILEWIDLKNNGNSNSISGLLSTLEGIAQRSTVLSQSARQFEIRFGTRIAKLRVIFSFCKMANINACKEYGEIRLLPDLTLQPCLISPAGGISIRNTNEQMMIDAFERVGRRVGVCPVPLDQFFSQ